MPAQTIIALNYKDLAYAQRAADGTWTAGSAPIGTRTAALAVDPVNQPGVIYIGTDGRGVLKTRDFGATWTPVGLDGHIVRSLAVCHLRPGTIYAGTKPAHMYVSHDFGRTWTEQLAFRQLKRWWWFTPAEKPMSAYVMDIVLSPTNPDVVIAGIEFGGVLRSGDGGKTWQGHMPGAIRDCHDLSYNPADGDWVYAGGGDGGAFSRDAGKTWSQPDPFSLSATASYYLLRRKSAPEAGKLDRRYGWAVAGDPARPNIWYLAASTGPRSAHGVGKADACIYRCTDGQRWERLSGGLPYPLDHFPYALLTDPAAPGFVYAVLQNGDIWLSQNHGDDWAPLPVNIGPMWYRAVVV